MPSVLAQAAAEAGDLRAVVNWAGGGSAAGTPFPRGSGFPAPYDRRRLQRDHLPLPGRARVAVVRGDDAGHFRPVPARRRQPYRFSAARLTRAIASGRGYQMRTITTVIGGFSLLLLALPAGAQPASPNTPASPSTAAPQGSGSAGMMGGMGMMGGQRGGMGMMMGQPPMDAGDEDDDGGPGRRMHRWRHGEARETPMQIIINIGPDNRVETEEHAWRGAGRERPMMGGERRGRSMAEHVHEHLGNLHDQLQLKPEQQAPWDRFATAVQDAVARMRSAPTGMAPGQSLEQRLAARETRLNSRLEAIRAIRSALSDLTGSLTDAQKHTLDEAFMSGASGMRYGWQ